MTASEPGQGGTGAALASLELADWRRCIAALYADVRERAATDPRAAWERWRAVREAMYREHPQSPVPAADRGAFRARYWPYDPALRFEVEVEAAEAAEAGALDPAPRPRLPMSTGAALEFSRIGRMLVPFAAGARTLDLFWMAGYAGGLFLPFRDATNGRETYGAGRYLLDGAKSADLGGDAAAGRLVLDFNFSFQPSCAFDPRWACPLAPPENRLDIAVEAGERIE
ncbi:MAG TPA: DUF1684 domain-containing protein [Candidatus Limnocylindrales bacterium]|nr:DUF1684 domain-containing protein [Candidatus Limnocylindrales bacterium]